MVTSLSQKIADLSLIGRQNPPITLYYCQTLNGQIPGNEPEQGSNGTMNFHLGL